MRCTKPRTVGFYSDGKTICWSPKKYSKEFSTFQIPCGKCISCRLEYARQWAVRCMHEAQMHNKNCFITLTYSDENLESPYLNYDDWKKFQKDLRSHIYNEKLKSMFPMYETQLERREAAKKITKEAREVLLREISISVFVTGEYGPATKRPHWHALIFNWEPPDKIYYRSNERGDKIYKSEILDQLWGKNDPEVRPSEIGSITFESAGYTARYSAKKLGHGKDQEHDFHPVSKKSSKNAIGKTFLEKYWKDIFNTGHCVLPNGKTCSIPRYYEKWLSKNHPSEYERYLMDIKSKQLERSIKNNDRIMLQQEEANNLRAQRNHLWKPQVTKDEARGKILEQKFEQLKKFLKI